MRVARSSIQVIRNARTRTRTYVALLLVLLLAGGINFLFIRDLTLIADDAPQADHDPSSSPVDGPTRRNRQTRHATEAEVENRTEWLLRVSRGKTLDMYNLTQLNDCKRLPSWRANEKRFIRLQGDRQKARNCIRTASLNHTQLFGLRAVADVTPFSHQYYMEYEHEDDDTPPETPVLYQVVAQYLKEHGVDTESQEGKQETERLFSLASVATSDAFLWGTASATTTHRPVDVHSVESMLASGRLRKSTAPRYSGRLELNPDALQECTFSKLKALSHPDLDTFSVEGYRLVEFMFQETFLRHGWITVPTAGTALGTLRHHGMFRGDDDMDMMTYPPAKYLLDKADWGDVYDEFDVLVESFGEENPSWFSWFRSNDYRTHRPWFTKNDKKKRLPTYPFREYEDHIRHDGRVCFSQYMTSNASEKRRLFMTEGCTPNHWFMCLQPATYIYARHDETFERHIIQDVQGIYTEDKALLPKHLSEIGPMIFTAFHRRPAGKFCKCKFGFLHNSTTTPSFGICFDNLPDFVQYWYDGKWCVPSGAVRTRKWSFLKSWND